MISFGNIFILTKKELKSYFLSPLIYIVAALFTLIVGWLFFNYLIIAKQVEHSSITDTVIVPIFGNLNFLFLLIAPITTMGVFTEEYKNNTMDLLHISKVNDLDIVLSKLIASVFSNLFLLLLTLILPIILFFSGHSDWGIFISCYFGMILSIFCYCSVGVFTSSISKNQIVASFLTFFLLFGLMLFALAANATDNQMVAEFIRYLGITFHYQGFARGAIRNYDVVYYLTFPIFFIFLTYKRLDARNW